jgi:hypothetical protein
MLVQADSLHTVPLSETGSLRSTCQVTKVVHAML